MADSRTNLMQNTDVDRKLFPVLSYQETLFNCHRLALPGFNGFNGILFNFISCFFFKILLKHAFCLSKMRNTDKICRLV